MPLNISSAKWRPFYHGHHVLMLYFYPGNANVLFQIWWLQFWQHIPQHFRWQIASAMFVLGNTEFMRTTGSKPACSESIDTRTSVHGGIISSKRWILQQQHPCPKSLHMESHTLSSHGENGWMCVAWWVYYMNYDITGRHWYPHKIKIIHTSPQLIANIAGNSLQVYKRRRFSGRNPGKGGIYLVLVNIAVSIACMLWNVGNFFVRNSGHPYYHMLKLFCSFIRPHPIPLKQRFS